ncbi:MAG: hypothetical protein LH616_13455, partial [Ilumatobacteraceae bacterium]|nr:hypothetical protein [Ilumatobacteraceae bacterium]
TNQSLLPTTAGERDGAPTPARTLTMLPQDALPLDLSDPRKLSSFTIAGGVAWPRPYLDFAPTTANTLSDLALYYWMRDLRPTYENNVPSSDGRGGKDLDWKKDPAWWQHVSFSAISFGSDGLLDADNRVATTNAIQAGTKDWFLPLNRPTPPNSPTTPLANPGATAVDDLWHATVNSRGTFVFAKTPVDVAYGLGSIISGIANNTKARAGSSFSGQQLTAGNDFIFQATIEPGWSGELKKVTINTTTGAETGTVWSAGVKLSLLLATPALGTSPVNEDDNKWFLNRRIVTRDPASGTVVPFRYGSLGATQRLTLGSTVAERQKAVAYLRGGSTFGAGPSPLLIEGTSIGQFRERSGKLGNISDSKPLVVGQPFAPFEDSNDWGYSTFKSTYAGRSIRVFVGANDGMFHSFDGTSNPTTGGDEVFAYIPSSVYTMDTDEGNIFRKGLFALTNQDGGAPIFKHHFYVNSSARWMDVDMNNCGANSACSPNWRSLVVGGMGKG